MSNQQDSSEEFTYAHLRADCENCFGLCCVALPFAATTDFAIDKEGGKPCPNLQNDFRCQIHRDLRQKGFRGCTVFDCLGAGQRFLKLHLKGMIGVNHKRQRGRCLRFSQLFNNFTKCFGT